MMSKLIAIVLIFVFFSLTGCAHNYEIQPTFSYSENSQGFGVLIKQQSPNAIDPTLVKNVTIAEVYLSTAAVVAAFVSYYLISKENDKAIEEQITNRPEPVFNN